MASLPISELKNATKVASSTIKTASGVTGTPPDDIKMSEFQVTSVVSSTSNATNIPYGGTFTVTLNLNGEQQYFNRIKNFTSHYLQSINTSRLSLISESGNTKTYQNIYNPGGTSGGSFVSESVCLKFYDLGYNENCANYNTFMCTTVNLYSAPKPLLAYVSTAATANCTSSLTVSFNSNPNLGINSTSIGIYYSTNNVNFTLHSTQTANSGNVTLAGLSPGVTYYLKAINNYNNSSDTLVITTQSQASPSVSYSSTGGFTGCSAFLNINYSSNGSGNVSIYYSTNNATWTLHSTQTAASGTVTISGLTRNTTYYIRAIGGNYSCVSGTITATTYNQASPTVAYSSTERPPRPCCGTSVGWKRPCCNATITITYTSPVSINIFRSTDNATWTLHSTQTATSGTVVIGGLTESTTYYIRGVDIYGCVSNTISATTLAYV
jgi:hypothetical protein